VKARDLRQLSREELVKDLAGHREALFRMRIRRATGEAATASEFSRLRREVARILTLLAEQDRTEAPQLGEQGASDHD
jgi:large subunit ribosomal protein L29